MHYRSRGTLPMPITLRLPSFGGIRAPEHHGESLEALFAHVPGLKVVSPSNPSEAYALLRQAIDDPDPVIFMEPKSRYWHKAGFDEAMAAERLPVGTSRIVRPGRHVTLIAWGAMVARCLQAAELGAEDGVEIEVVDLRWLKPIDADGVAESVSRTRRAVVVHEAPLTAGLGAEVSALLMERCFADLRAPVGRVTGYDVPYPSPVLEDEYLPEHRPHPRSGPANPGVPPWLRSHSPFPTWARGCRRRPCSSGWSPKGDYVERNAPLVEVETTKSAVELPSPQSGTVARFHVAEGDALDVGEPLITFEVADDAAGIVGTVPG